MADDDDAGLTSDQKLERGVVRTAFNWLVILAALAVPVVALHLAAPWGLWLLGQPEPVVELGGEYAQVIGLSVVALGTSLRLSELVGLNVGDEYFAKRRAPAPHPRTPRDRQARDGR